VRELRDPNCVTALRAGNGRALIFSRAPVPGRANQESGG